jgi:hypothetical protein
MKRDSIGGSTKAIIDTGTSLMYFPTDAFLDFYNIVGGTLYNNPDLVLIEGSCSSLNDSMPLLSFKFGDV